MKLFSYDSKFSQTILKLCYSCYLNMLWFLCSIPVFTAGAATAALYDVTLRISRGEEPPLTSRFFRAFRENFRQSTILWLGLLAFGILLSLDGYILYNLYKSTTGILSIACTLGLAVVIVAAILYTIVLLYIFPLIASVRNRSWPMLKNALCSAPFWYLPFISPCFLWLSPFSRLWLFSAKDCAPCSAPICSMA